MPRNYLLHSNILDGETWYRKNISRIEADSLLMAIGQEGCFQVYDAEVDEAGWNTWEVDNYSLSVIHDKKVITSFLFSYIQFLVRLLSCPTRSSDTASTAP